MVRGEAGAGTRRGKEHEEGRSGRQEAASDFTCQTSRRQLSQYWNCGSFCPRTSAPRNHRQNITLLSGLLLLILFFYLHPTFNAPSTSAKCSSFSCSYPSLPVLLLLLLLLSSFYSCSFSAPSTPAPSTNHIFSCSFTISCSPDLFSCAPSPAPTL